MERGIAHLVGGPFAAPVFMFAMDKVGDFEVRLIGKGDFNGKAKKIFRIVLDEDEAAQAVEDAKAELAKAQAAIAALDENASSADMTAALKELVTAQKILTDAQDSLARTRDILSKEKESKLAGQIADLQQQIEDLNEQLKAAQIINISLYPYVIKLEKESYEYTGEAIEPEVEVAGLDAYDYTVSYYNNTDIGTATVLLQATGERYKGSIFTTFKITKRTNTLAVKGKTAKVKYVKLEKKAQSLDVDKVIKVTDKGQGTRTYAKVSGDKRITIGKKTGKVTVKEGLKKGTYKVKVKVKAAGNATYDASVWKKVTFKIKVK